MEEKRKRKAQTHKKIGLGFSFTNGWHRAGKVSKICRILVSYLYYGKLILRLCLITVAIKPKYRYNGFNITVLHRKMKLLLAKMSNRLDYRELGMTGSW